jgi:hypothetical protein
MDIKSPWWNSSTVNPPTGWKKSAMNNTLTERTREDKLEWPSFIEILGTQAG